MRFFGPPCISVLHIFPTILAEIDYHILAVETGLLSRLTSIVLLHYLENTEAWKLHLFTETGLLNNVL